MVDVTVRYGKDTWVGQGKPTLNHNGDAYLRVCAATGLVGYTFLFLRSPVPHGERVLSAKLQVYAYSTSAWTGTKTLTAKRCAKAWSPSGLTWNNQPAVVASAPVSTTVTNATDGQLIELDVTHHVQTFANGGSNYGWRIETNSTSGHRIYGFASAYPPRLVVSYVDPPSVPTDLAPQGGAVAVGSPIITFSATDLTNPGDMASLQVQIDPAASTTAPGFDSGEVATTVPELDLSTTTYAGLADGATTQWRARVKNSAGVWSDWSGWVSFSRDDKGTLVISNPAAPPNNYVTEATPPIIWSFTGETQSHWLVQIVDPTDHTVILAESGKVAGTDNSWTIPKNVIHDDDTYTVRVRVWDTKVRVATPGVPRYTEALQDFTFKEDPTTDAPTGLTAVQDGPSPWVNLTWTRTTAPDSFTIRRDGKNIEADLDPADVLVPGTTTYTWRDPQAFPASSHTYSVRAVVNGKASPRSNLSTVKTGPVGIWLLDKARNQSAVIFGDDPGTWAMPDDAAVYNVIGSDKVVRIVSGMHGLEGTITGTLVDALGYLASDQEDVLMSMKEHPSDTFQLVLADTNIPVELGNITVAPTPDTVAGGPVVRHVSFDFWQVGNLPFTPRF